MKEQSSRVKTQKRQSRAKEEVFEEKNTLSRVSKIEMQHPGCFKSI